jgi:Zn-dependent protease
LTPEQIAQGIISYVVLLFSLSVHESAHGWMALRMGDDTAASQGRVSLNPLVHLDLVGTVLIPLAQFFSPYGRFLIGWAKPTPVSAHNFRKLAQGHLLVAGAGPASNMLLAAIFTCGLFVVVRAGVAADSLGPLVEILKTGIVMNIGLAVFNLVPLPPLDGSWIASWGLPRNLAVHYDRIMEPYGQWILLALFVTGGLNWIVRPAIGLILTGINLLLR